MTGFASGGFPRVNPLQPEQGGGDVFVARIGPEGLTPQPPAGLGLAWGSGETGELGDSGSADSAVPVLPKHTPDLIAIAAGRQHSLAVRADGSVIAWGSNDDGALGDGTTNPAHGVIPVPTLDSGFVAVAAGDNFSLALRADGTVVGWGANDRGQLGNGGTGPALAPTPVSGLTGVVAISAGIAHSLALRWDGSEYAWGWNEYGQLGTNGTADSALPIAVATLGSGVAGIAAGGTHSLAVKASGAVLAWGANKEGQLGTNSMVGSLVPIGVSGLSSGVVAVAGGGTHSLALTSAGAVKAWGANGDGQLGSNAQTGGSLVPVEVGGLASGVTKVAAGDTHNLAIGAGGAVLAWGGGSQGELGNGAVAASAAPVQVVGLGTGPWPSPPAGPTAWPSLPPPTFPRRSRSSPRRPGWPPPRPCSRPAQAPAAIRWSSPSIHRAAPESAPSPG